VPLVPRPAGLLHSIHRVFNWGKRAGIGFQSGVPANCDVSRPGQRFSTVRPWTIYDRLPKFTLLMLFCDRHVTPFPVSSVVEGGGCGPTLHGWGYGTTAACPACRTAGKVPKRAGAWPGSPVSERDA
jgi:hypothetical protein